MTPPEEPDTLALTVVGGGLMGASIASVFVAIGHHVTVVEADATRRAGLADLIQSQINDIDTLSPAASSNGARKAVDVTADLRSAAKHADIVIESVTENRVVKESVWAELGESTGPSTILATNTSSLGVSELAGLVPSPSRVLGMHFFNPAHLLTGVEIVVTDQTEPAVVDSVMTLLIGAGKDPVIVNDTPGFVVNRLQFVLIAEALRLIDEGVARPENIDRLIETTLGPRWLAGGPMISADAAGLDVYFSILQELQSKLGERYDPPQIIGSLVKQGALGAKTSRGLISDNANFYAASQASRFAKLRRILQTLRADTDSSGSLGGP